MNPEMEKAKKLTELLDGFRADGGSSPEEHDALALRARFQALASDAQERAGLKAWVWALIILVPVLGTVTWLVVSRVSTALGGRRARRSPAAYAMNVETKPQNPIREGHR